MSISESEALHRRSIIVDGHCDTPYRLLRHNVHLDEHDPKRRRICGRCRRVGSRRRSSPRTCRRSTPDARGGVRASADRPHRGRDRSTFRCLTLCADSAGIRAAKRDDKIAVMIGVEGATPSRTRSTSCASSTPAARAT